MQLENIIQCYKNTIDAEQQKLDKLKSSIFTVGSLRLAVVLVCAFVIYLNWFLVMPILVSIAISSILFLFLLKYHNRLFYKKRYCELLIENAKNELKAIDYNFSAFDGAGEQEDASHSYSLDLDLFGKQSFFQSINRTVTDCGKQKLINNFLLPSDNKDEIIENQSIIKELSNKPLLLQHFRAVGQLSETEHLDVKNFVDQFDESKSLAKSLWRFSPFIPLILIAVYAFVAHHYNFPTSFGGILYVVLMTISLVPLGFITQKMSLFDKKIDSLQSYSELFKVIEHETFQSGELLALQSKLRGHQSASKSIRSLMKTSHNLGQSQNVFGILVLNPFFHWHIIYALKVEKWVKENKSNIDTWFQTLAQFDSFVSLSLFAYNHPTYTYPEVSDRFIFEAKGLGHPMIHRKVCVCNDVNISQHPYFLVVTGANMAGKSTYLRTVGLSLIMASVGLPVFAQSLQFFPFHLVTNLRTSDSLADNESYFFAELKRLKMIIDRLQSKENIFIILDEILKGTNSQDKQKGSIALMKQLIANKGCGIIATHDLILGDLEKEYPDDVKNYRFEADITDNELTFSYHIREGVAQNMNACFLMSKMGITGLE